MHKVLSVMPFSSTGTSADSAGMLKGCLIAHTTVTEELTLVAMDAIDQTDPMSLNSVTVGSGVLCNTMTIPTLASSCRCRKTT